jgi:PEP-CTERM/exosortase A-associated glycosyltransferase
MSGYSSRSESIIRFQAALGMEPVVLTSAKHPATLAPVEEIDGITYHRTPTLGKRSSRVPYLAQLGLMRHLAGRIADVARAERVDLLHVHSPVLNGLPALWAGRRLGLPVVYEARAFWEDAAVDHGSTREGSLRYRVSRALETVVFRRAAVVVTIAQAMRDEIARRGIAGGKIHVVPNGVDTDWFRPAPPPPRLAAALGLGGGPVVGFIGSFYHYEGLEFLLEASGELGRRLPEATLLLVGAGPDDARLRARARQLRARTIFTGAVPPAAIRDYYGLLDVFVCPRRRMRLTELVTPLKPLEAMAMGRPVVASDVGGLAELIRHESTGLLFRAESLDAFVTETARVATDAELRTGLGARARAHVTDERAWPKIIRRYEDVYGAARGGARLPAPTAGRP